MDKTYIAKDHEDRIYSLWEKSGAFSPAEDLKKPPFCIIMPPPNANDPLHIGHAMFATVEDILVRFHRMLGEATLWLPGTDHAGIETQFVFEKKLSEQGKSRFDFDRETLYRRIWDYVSLNSDTALLQLRRLGASADWSRFRFTLDPHIVAQVVSTFEQLHRDGLVYRDLRLVNYCTGCGTAFSDLEVRHVTRKDPLYYIHYGPLTLATVRPETKFGDTAVAVHPQDERYKSFVGKTIEVQGLLGNFSMEVIADSAVDPGFGTGVVKVTPAHDPTDFAIGKRHRLALKQVIDFEGKLNERAGKYAGLSVSKARRAVAQDLKRAGLVEKIDTSYEHAVGVCYRCGTVIEPLPMPQFYIKVKPLTKPALKALDSKEVVVYGAGHDKVLRHWLLNLEDWNISRQIVWGIRIPVWYQVQSSKFKVQSRNSDIFVSFLNRKKNLVSGKIGTLLNDYTLTEIKGGLQSLRAPVDAEYVVSPTSPGKGYLPETDTFDTWFSSAQWPVVTLQTGRPGDFERFYPTSIMETGYDILPFWVMRMLFMGIYRTGRVPFRKVYLHGLIRDEKGRKMSKSKGNVINPLDVIELYGADALRMALVMSTTAGQDSAMGETKIRGMRNLTNKIWNASRYLVMQIQDSPFKIQDFNRHGPEDKKFLRRLDEVVKTTTKQLSDLKIGLAAETVYLAFWHWFCDECIEQQKRGKLSRRALVEGCLTFLKLLHPFVPFITEVCYQEVCGVLPGPIRKKLVGSELVLCSGWPAVVKKAIPRTASV